MQKPLLQIRPATEADRNEVIHLFRQYGFSEHSLGNWADHCIKQEKTTMFLGIANDRVVAFGRVAMIGGGAHLHDLYTDPECRKQGIATAMMRVCEDWARGQNAQILQLNVYEGNQRARDLYEASGYNISFNHASAGAGESPQTPEYHHVMIKHLNGPT